MLKQLSTLAVLCLAIAGAPLMVQSARAQQPTPLPHVPLAIPVTPPPGWVPKQWAELRARCQERADELAAHRSIPQVDWSLREVCGSLGVIPPPPPAGYPPKSSFSGSSRVQSPLPTPATSPSPPGLSPQSATAPPTIGPFRTPFAIAYQ